MSTEVDIMRRIQVALTTVGARVFRNNQGTGWVGRLYKPTIVEHVTVGPGDVVLYGARPLHAGLITGSSDLIGWTHDGRFLGVEVKRIGNTPTVEQEQFIRAVKMAGGRGFVAYGPQDAVDKYKEAA